MTTTTKRATSPGRAVRPQAEPPVELQVFRDMDAGGIWKIQAVRGDTRETVTSWWNPEEADAHAGRLAAIFGCDWRRVEAPPKASSELPNGTEGGDAVE